MHLLERAKLTLSWLVVVVVLGALCWRITAGLDLSDEAYYAAFVDDWIKGSIASSTFLVVHQTAALLVYPLALAYDRLTGSTEGLLLFLRCLFLAGNCVAAAVLFLFARRFTGYYCALALGLASVSFIPLGIPAPSYNSIGLQGLIVALASTGLACLAASAAQRLRWQWVSALAWGVTVIAYPPFVAVAAGLCLLMAVCVCRREGVGRYAMLVAACVALAALLVTEVFSLAKLHDSMTFLVAFSGVQDMHRKLGFLHNAFLYGPTYTYLYAAAIAVGVLRPLLSGTLTALCLAALLLVPLYLFPYPSFAGVFLARNAIALVALGGLGLLRDLRSNDAARRTIAVLYSASLLAGTVVAAASSRGILSYAIGVFPASLLSVAATGLAPGDRRAAVIATAMFGLVLLVTSLTLFFGEAPFVPVTRERVTWGEAKGLSVRSGAFAAITAMRDVAMPLARPGDTILVLGGSPGLMLQTPLRVKALNIFPMTSPPVTARAIALTHAWYETPANRPDMVIVYTDIAFLNPFGVDFTAWYAPVRSRNLPGGLFEVFRKRVTPPP